MPPSDPKREFAVDVVRTLARAGFTALWAGGCVRDLLLGRPPDDYDVATSARPEEVQKLFGPRRTLAIGASFGVILVHGPRGSGAGDVEVATFRTEGPYLDGRRPEHVVFATPEEDAHRRDFTINGMFYDPIAEELKDFVGGRDDLAAKIVRAIGDPPARFREDKLRMLRAVRIAARFDFEIDPPTADAAHQMAREILVVSQERIADELKKMLVHPRRARAVGLAQELHLLTVILPELAPICASAGRPGSEDRWQVTRATLDRLEIPRFELALAALLHEVTGDHAAAAKLVEQACRRLKLSNQECDDISWLVGHRAALQGAPAFRKSRLIHELIGLESAHAHVANESLADVEFCQHYLRTTPMHEINPPPVVNGEDLKALGIEPGPQYKEILEKVRDAQLDGVISTREEAIEFIRRLLGQ